MPTPNMVTAFNRFGAKLVNHNWAVSAISKNNKLVVSCGTHYLKSGGGVIKYGDRLSRWDHNSPEGNLLRSHLETALLEDLTIRLVTVRTEETG